MMACSRETRSAAAAASGLGEQPLAPLQRVRPRTLLTIAALAGAFYFVLPQLADVGSSWQALRSADWIWLPVIIACSAVTYLASAAALIGAAPGRVPFWPTTLTQAASSFVNRVSPANVGGMALNARFLQKSGVSPGAGVAAVGVNALMGAVAHLILLVIFFALASHRMTQAFKLPPASKLLLILAIAAASPTPGGLGAIEAALVAGLTGIGIPPGPAVSAVLTYRLATYWLPVAPGWAALRILQRRDYV